MPLSGRGGGHDRPTMPEAQAQRDSIGSGEPPAMPACGLGALRRGRELETASGQRARGRPWPSRAPPAAARRCRIRRPSRDQPGRRERARWPSRATATRCRRGWSGRAQGPPAARHRDGRGRPALRALLVGHPPARRAGSWCARPNTRPPWSCGARRLHHGDPVPAQGEPPARAGRPGSGGRPAPRGDRGHRRPQPATPSWRRWCGERAERVPAAARATSPICAWPPPLRRCPAELEHASQEKLSHSAFLDRLLGVEVAATEERRLAGRPRRFACLPAPWHLSDFDFEAQP